MVLTRTYGIDKDLWYRQGLMVLTTPMVLTETHGIKSVLLNHTRTRGPSVTRMRDFLGVILRPGRNLPYRWKNGWMDARMDGCMYEWIGLWMHGLMYWGK